MQPFVEREVATTRKSHANAEMVARAQADELRYGFPSGRSECEFHRCPIRAIHAPNSEHAFIIILFRHNHT
jgi:hypothetical protein